MSFVGGAEESLCTLLRLLDRNRFEPLVVIPSDGSLRERLLREKVRVEIVPWGNMSNMLSRKSLFSILISPFAIPQMCRFLFKLKRIVKRENIFLIHTNGLKCHFLGGILGFWTGTKVIWHIRDIYISRFIRAALKIFREIIKAEVIVISEAVKASLGLRGSCLIYNGVDITTFRSFFPRKDLREELGLSRDTDVVTMIGVLTPWKGQHIFLEAIARLKEHFLNLRGIIVGEELYTGIGHRGYSQYLKDRVKVLGIEERIRFLGFRDDIPSIINSSTVMVHASLMPEPFGRVIIESMACEKPVVATRGGAVEEILRDRIDGIIVEPGKDSDLAQAIAYILKDKNSAKEMGRNGRERVEKMFSAEKMARKIETFYLEGLRFCSQRQK